MPSPRVSEVRPAFCASEPLFLQKTISLPFSAYLTLRQTTHRAPLPSQKQPSHFRLSGRLYVDAPNM